MNKQLQLKNTSYFARSKQQNLRENVKELFNTLKEQNGLAWKEIVRNYKQQQEREICTLIDTRLFHTAENGTMENKIRKQK